MRAGPSSYFVRAPFSLLVCLSLLLSATLMPRVQADACASYHNCLSCSNSSMTCHWCAADNACHTIGSPYGCLYGVNCYGNEACVRTEPQPMGHKAPSGSIIIGLGVFLLSTLLCTGACYFVANEYVNHATTVRIEKDPNYQELVVCCYFVGQFNQALFVITNAAITVIIMIFSPSSLGARGVGGGRRGRRTEPLRLQVVEWRYS